MRRSLLSLSPLQLASALRPAKLNGSRVPPWKAVSHRTGREKEVLLFQRMDFRKLKLATKLPNSSVKTCTNLSGELPKIGKQPSHTVSACGDKRSTEVRL